MVIILSVLCITLGCVTSEEPPRKSVAQNLIAEFTEISVNELKSRFDNGDILIIDVRTENEFIQGHLPTAKNIPLSKLSKDSSSIDKYKNKEVYLICAVGGRSGNAQRILSSRGFLHTINVTGGTKEWVASNYPLEKE
jgi:rhodanese-related sulfurtransferase